ncbi:MAG: sensor histidine kinase, partial [Burkholderiales bacterium]
GSPANILSEPQFRAELAKFIDTDRMGALRFQVNVDAAAFERLSPGEMEHVLHIAREALSNAFRHSHAHTGLLELQIVDDGVRLEISDDGIGFERGELEHGRRGLLNMESRARQIGATLDVVSGALAGTRIILRIPKRTLGESSHP